MASEPDTLSPLLRATHPADVVFTYRTILDLEQGGGSSLSFRADTDYRGGAPQVEKFTMAIVEDDDVRVRHAPV
ncbi:hypothetical protein [Streptomyces nigra]